MDQYPFILSKLSIWHSIAQLLLISSTLACIHHQVAQKVRMLTIDDQPHNRAMRLLQQTHGTSLNLTGSIRMHMDYSGFDTGTVEGKYLVNLMEVAKAFWERTLQLPRLMGLTYPLTETYGNDGKTCYNTLVPDSVLKATFANKDFGFLVRMTRDGSNDAVAQSYPCAYLLSTKRPIWALISFNADYFSFDALSVQNAIYVAVHEMTHCLGFSYLLYEFYPAGNPTKQVNGIDYIATPAVIREVKRQYGCESAIGMPLETEGSLGTAGTHWSRKASGNEYMTATVTYPNPTISYITLALLESTGWYTHVYTEHGRFINYGYQSGCKTLNLDDCSGSEFCKEDTEKGCDFDYISGSHCTNDSYSKKCKYFQYYTNYICTDPNYSNKNVNNIGTTGEKAGYNSRCFSSTIRGVGEAATKYSMRCFPVTCSDDHTSITLQIGQTKTRCRYPGQILTVPGFDGTITCPMNFRRLCFVKACPNLCNANGICIDGNCICNQRFTGSNCLTPAAKGATNALSAEFTEQIRGSTCVLGSYLTEFGDCQLCPSKCIRCTRDNCLVCWDGSAPLLGHCL